VLFSRTDRLSNRLSIHHPACHFRKTRYSRLFGDRARTRPRTSDIRKS